ncbi:lysozyme inhibitor LprI family protein [Roseivivax sp. CAU 1753]
MLSRFALWACACVGMPVLSAMPAAAQTPNCADPTTQVEMTGCAGLEYERADAELNRVWRMAVATVRRWDKTIGPADVPAEDILRDAQRAWIPFRDQACEAESLAVRGGSMQSQVFLMCLTRLTTRRTEDLASFGFGG